MADHCSWQEGQGKTFKILEEKMTTHPVIVLPDFTKGFRLSTDASDAATASTLEQVDNNGNLIAVIGYFRRI